MRRPRFSYLLGGEQVWTAPESFQDACYYVESFDEMEKSPVKTWSSRYFKLPLLHDRRRQHGRAVRAAKVGKICRWKTIPRNRRTLFSLPLWFEFGKFQRARNLQDFGSDFCRAHQIPWHYTFDRHSEVKHRSWANKLSAAFKQIRSFSKPTALLVRCKNS